MIRRKLVVLTLALSGFAFAQSQVGQTKTVAPARAGTKPASATAAPQAPAEDPVDGVLTMVQAGLSDDIIITKLRKDGKAFDLSSEQMIRLKRASVSDAVLKIMLDPKAEIKQPGQPAFQPVQPTSVVIQSPVIPGLTPNPSGATPVVGSATAGDPNDPLTPHDSGIYLYTKDRDGKPQMIVLERAAYQGAKTGGALGTALTYGIKKMKTKAVIPGPRASIRSTDANPVFYFYFDDKAAGLGKSYFGSANVSNPNQFALLKLDTTKSNRETTIGEFNAFGASSGTNEKSMIGIKSERLRAGLYKVTMNVPLQVGEYCFLASSGALGAYGAGAGGAGDLFDFGTNLQ